MKPTVWSVPVLLASSCLWLVAVWVGPVAVGADDPLALAQSRFATFGTNKVHYLAVGKGKRTIVFVHCWAGRAEFWRLQVPALANQARLILVDLPGHGRSDQPHVAYTMEFFGRAVLAAMRDANVDQATLVGHSMGVPVICWVHKLAPEQVTGLVAVDGFLRQPKFDQEQAKQFVGPFRGPDYRAHTTNFIYSMFFVPGSDALRDQVLTDILRTPQHVMVGAMDGMFNPEAPAWDLHDVKVPVLVLNAKNPIWTAAYEEYVRNVSPQVEYRTFDGVGHWLMLEKPAEFNAALVGWLEKHRLTEK